MMVVTIDHKSQQVGIVSIPRDLYVDIPGHGMDRINAADFVGTENKYPGGGPALAQRVVKDALGIPTQNYVRIKQNGLVKLVDTLGGVTVTLECPLYERTPDDKSPTGYQDWSLPAGENFLDGASAKKFATYRYLSSDFGRARRQQLLIWAIRNRALQLDMIPRIPELWSALSDTFETDIGLLDVIKLARLGVGLQSEQIHGLVLDQEVVQNYTTPGGGAVLVIKDPDLLRKKLANLFGSKPISELGKAQGKCPPAPAPLPLLPSATPTSTPPTGTPEITTTPTPEATAAPAPG